MLQTDSSCQHLLLEKIAAPVEEVVAMGAGGVVGGVSLFRDFYFVIFIFIGLLQCSRFGRLLTMVAIALVVVVDD